MYEYITQSNPKKIVLTFSLADIFVISTVRPNCLIIKLNKQMILDWGLKLFQSRHFTTTLHPTCQTCIHEKEWKKWRKKKFCSSSRKLRRRRPSLGNSGKRKQHILFGQDILDSYKYVVLSRYIGLLLLFSHVAELIEACEKLELPQSLFCFDHCAIC